MTCVHLKELYELCRKNEIRIGGLDMVRMVCRKCNVKETCPSVLADEYDVEQSVESTESGENKSAQ